MCIDEWGSKPLGEGLDCLGGLRQLTWLQLDLCTRAPPRDQLACLGALRRLAVLDWCVVWPADEGENSDEEALPENYHLPALPASLRHLRVAVGNRMVLGRELPALTGLQTLIYDMCCNEEVAAAFSSLRSLTALVMNHCECAELPAVLPALTSLSYLDFNCSDMRGLAGTLGQRSCSSCAAGPGWSGWRWRGAACSPWPLWPALACRFVRWMCRRILQPSLVTLPAWPRWSTCAAPGPR